MDEELRIDLELEDGTKVTCAVITLLEVDDQTYIAITPLDEKGEANEEGEVWFYRYEESDDPEADPDLGYIEDDEEYEAVADAFDEFLDELDFEELMAQDDED